MFSSWLSIILESPNDPVMIGDYPMTIHYSQWFFHSCPYYPVVSILIVLYRIHIRVNCKDSLTWRFWSCGDNSPLINITSITKPSFQVNMGQPEARGLTDLNSHPRVVVVATASWKPVSKSSAPWHWPGGGSDRSTTCLEWRGGFKVKPSMKKLRNINYVYCI